MLIIGVTGNIGSGKTTVSKILEEQGAYVINADKIARGVLAKDGAGYGETVAYFGEGIVGRDGEIDRRALAAIVFSDPGKLDVLNAFTHKHVKSRINEEIAAVRQNNAHDIICLDVPLLFESGLNNICDAAWVVDAGTEIKLARVMERDKTDRSSAELRLARQPTREELRQKGDIIIENNGDYDRLKMQVLLELFKLALP